jgi:lysophospholipase L1-like esterase
MTSGAPLASRVLTTAAGLVLLLGVAVPGPSGPASSDPDATRFQEEIDRFRNWDARNSSPRNAVLFLGSSTIRLWETALFFPALRVVNRGFGGSVIADVIDRLEVVLDPHDPSLIVFYTGDNDVAEGKSAEQVLEDFELFLLEVRRRKPGTAVLFISIKPSLDRWSRWPEMKRANQMIRSLSQRDEDVFYVDMATIMLTSGGTPNPDFFVDDGLHLSQAGYVAWSDLLRDAIDSILDERGLVRRGVSDS